MARTKNRIRVGVLRGGVSPEYSVSLKTGASVLRHLPDHYKAHDVLLTKNGQWHLDGMPVSDTRVFDTVDVIFNALHGAYGEDGKLQQQLDAHNVRYTGSGAYASAIGMNKIRAKEMVSLAGIRTAPWVVGDISKQTIDQIARTVCHMSSPPWVVKDPFGGSSIGVYITKTHDDLNYTLEKLFMEGISRVLIEQYLVGREATCGIIDHFRGQPRYVLPVIEIVPPRERHFFDYTCKYDGTTREICPALFKHEEKREIERVARETYGVLGCRHYARADFILTPMGPYFLEINTLPGLTEQSLMPKAVEAVGSSYKELLDHVIMLALR
ncbi:MAG: D-alanine--D-alanine ligase [bacterium]|nr:D-alanine--D-alanine ligase [bacterium]